MQYMGGKMTIAKKIIETLDKTYEYERFVEPFAGMASLSRYTKAQNIYLNDLDINIYTFLKELHELGWQDLPDFVTEEEHKAANNLEPSRLKTFIKIGCSFGGMWRGVYAKRKATCKLDDGVTNFARTTKNSCQVMYEALKDKDITFSNKDYSELEYKKTDLIYLDPPYNKTERFSVGKFDSQTFFNWMREMSANGYQVVCSEYAENLPDGAHIVWEKTIRQRMGNQATKTEIVFSF